jgi:hypothetical protein
MSETSPDSPCPRTPLHRREFHPWIGCLARKLSEDEYNDWAELHNRAEQAIEKRDKLLMESYNRYDNHIE